MDKFNKLLNKTIKWLFMFIIIAVSYTAINDDTPGYVSDAQSELYVNYIEKVYLNRNYTVKCDKQFHSGVWVVFCHTKGSSRGGIYQIEPYYDDVIDYERYKLFSLNGTAKSHASKMGLHIPMKYDSTVKIEDVKNYKKKTDI